MQVQSEVFPSNQDHQNEASGRGIGVDVGQVPPLSGTPYLAVFGCFFYLDPRTASSQ